MSWKPSAIGYRHWTTEKNSRRRAFIMGVIRRNSLKRGRETQRVFKNFCDWTQEEDLICHHHEGSTYDDRIRKIDHLIKDNEGRWHKIQVKSSLSSLLGSLTKNYRGLLDYDQRQKFDSLNQSGQIETLLDYLVDLGLIDGELVFVIISGRDYTRDTGINCVLRAIQCRKRLIRL